mgnify:FL=1
MIKVAVAGYAGRMGSAVVDAVTAADDMTVVCGIDPHAKETPFPVFGTLAEAGVYPRLISTSETKIGLIVAADEMHKAVSALRIKYAL